MPTLEQMVALIMEVEGANGWSEEMRERLERRLLDMNPLRREGMYNACLKRKAEKASEHI